MIAYIIAGLVLLLLLIGAYRAFGGAAARPLDSRALLRAAFHGLESLPAEVGAAAAPAPGTVGPARNDMLRQLRRRIEAASQQLQQTEVAKLSDAEAAAHMLLGVAADELGWAVRLLQAGSYAEATGLHDAVTVLCAHAQGCTRETVATVQASAAAEEVSRPA